MLKFVSMNIKTKQHGFTLIELLVVIAIIGILAAITLVFLGGAKQSGSEASSKASINSFKTQAELMRSTTGSFATVCAATSTATILKSIAAKSLDSNKSMDTAAASPSSPTEAVCHSVLGSWAISVPMTGNKYFCADSVGISGFRTSPLLANLTVCPAT